MIKCAFYTLLFITIQRSLFSITNTIKPQTTSNEFTISFISMGTGIDNNTYKKVEEFLSLHKPKITYIIISQGREGEKEIELDLKNQKIKDKQKILSKLKALTNSNKRVYFNKKNKK